VSKENVEIVRAMYDAYDRGAFEEALGFMAEDVEWSESPDQPGGRLFRGHDGVRQSLRHWVGTWDDYRYEVDELVDCGDHVLARTHQSGRGKGSGIEVSEEIFSVWTLRDGKIVRQEMFRNWSQALEAAGIRE
jgi:ketosteroid isomerase-like protein